MPVGNQIKHRALRMDIFKVKILQSISELWNIWILLELSRIQLFKETGIFQALQGS